MTTDTTLTALLREAGHGRRAAFDRLLPVVYASLRRIASGALRGERAGHTLTPTALAHEAYVRLIGLRHVAWQDRAHFFAMAARTMRRVLVNHAVARRARKRGAGAAPVDIESVPLARDDRLEEVLAVHEALERLQAVAPAAARVVECRVFLGMTIEETAAAIAPPPGAAGPPGAAPPLQPLCVGPYLILSELGRGGMGIVFLARRADGQYTRDVALKVAQSPMFDEGFRERFLAERDILARLSHRNIAALFDGGVTDEGRPYFTMEYVDGRPIDTYCDDERLDTEARIRLFLQVCDAVSAAHRSLVVHRDLKPSNVLVSAGGDAKLLDFGIAKLLDPVRSTDATRPAGRLFTRDYASPEQVLGGAVTTASDVYSLGALLYRLLTGRLAHRFDGDRPADVERAICEVEPAPPGLDGDLDTIVLKALSKDPARRYASVDLLAHDLDRYLRGWPVSARPDSRAYRAGKFVRRHRVAVAAAALVSAALGVGAAATLVQAQKARVAAARAHRISIVVTELFRLAEPGRLEGGTITARELLDRGAERIADELRDDPDAQATMYRVLGRLYRNLALYEPARHALVQAIEQRRKVSGEESLGLAEALVDMADLQFEHAEYAEAEGLFRRALALRRRLGAAPREMAEALEGLGRVLSSAGKHGEAGEPLREALDLRRRYGGDRGTELVATLHELALARLLSGNSAGGEPLFREAVELGRRLPASSADLRVEGLVNLARLRLHFDRKPAEAAALFREALELARRWYPEAHPDVAVCLGELAGALRELGALAEAEALASKSLTLWRRLYGPEHREVIVATERLARVLVDRGRAREAEPLLRQAFDAGRSRLGDGHPLTLTAQAELAAFLQNEGRFAEAETLKESALAAARRTYGEKDVYVARAWAALGQLHAATGERMRAEMELRQAVSVRRQIHKPGHWRIAEAEAALAAFLSATGKRGEAEVLLVGAVETLQRAGSRYRREREAALRHRDAVRRARDEARGASHWAARGRRSQG